MQITSGIQELDQLFGGGIDSGTSTLLMGPAGCGKSTLAIRYAVSAAEQGLSAAVFAFDETLNTLVGRAKGLGMDLERHIKSGKFFFGRWMQRNFRRASLCTPSVTWSTSKA